MTSQSLYRKWRSQTFSTLVGQEPVSRTLLNAVRSGKIAHAYLFTGPRGTGKTSSARLLAKAVNCLNQHEGEPCNECQQCREITAGISLNVIEIDAASNRGIDSIRELREKVMLPPVSAAYKVYVLDEAHMLTTEACNALLKTLEEPPPYALFILATTEVHKILPTIMTRCQRFDFKRISVQDITHHLQGIAKAEQVQLDPDAALFIARSAAGGMRDAISLLDQSLAYAGSHITLYHMQEMLGVADPSIIHAFVAHVANLEEGMGLKLINELSEGGADMRQVNNQLAEYWRILMLLKTGVELKSEDGYTSTQIAEMKQLAGRFPLPVLLECMHLHAQSEPLRYGPPQLALELAFLKCVEAHRTGNVSRGVPSPEIHPKDTPILPKLHPVLSTIPSNSTLTGQSDTASPKKETGKEEKRRESPGDTLLLEQVQQAWDMIRKRVKQRENGPRTAALLVDFRVVQILLEESTPVILLQANHTFHYEQMKGDHKKIADVAWAMSLEFGRECLARVIPPADTPRATGKPVAFDIPHSVRMEDTSDPLSAPYAEQSMRKVVREQESPFPVIIEKQEASSFENPEEPLELIVQRNPVVQNVLRTFKARVASVRSLSVESE